MCITITHIENDVPMQFEPRVIQFDVVKIVVQVGTGKGYCAFVLKNKNKNLTGLGCPEGTSFVRIKD